MKKIYALSFLAILCWAPKLFAQESYYWFGKQKIILTPDSSSLYIKLRPHTNAAHLKQTLSKQLASSDSLIRIFSSDAVVIRNETNIRKNGLIIPDSLIQYASPLLTNGSARIIIIPAITVAINEGQTVQELLDLYPSLSINSEMSFNTYVLSVNSQSHDDVLAIANENPRIRKGQVV